MSTIICTALLSSVFTAIAFLFMFNKIIKPYLTTQLANIKQELAHIKQEAKDTISQTSPQISQDIANAIEAKILTLRPELETHIKQELNQVIDDFLPQLSKEVEDGVDNSFRKFIPTVMGSAASMPAETLLKTSSTLFNTGLDILKRVTPEVKK